MQPSQWGRLRGRARAFCVYHGARGGGVAGGVSSAAMTRLNEDDRQQGREQWGNSRNPETERVHTALGVDPQKFSSDLISHLFWTDSSRFSGASLSTGWLKRLSTHCPRESICKGKVSSHCHHRRIYYPILGCWKISPQHSEGPVHEPGWLAISLGEEAVGRLHGVEGRGVPQLPRRVDEFICAQAANGRYKIPQEQGPTGLNLVLSYWKGILHT